MLDEEKRRIDDIFDALDQTDKMSLAQKNIVVSMSAQWAARRFLSPRQVEILQDIASQVTEEYKKPSNFMQRRYEGYERQK